MTGKRKIIAAVVAVCILVVAAVGAYYFLQKPGIDLKQLPVEWKKVDDLKLKEGASCAVYQGTGTLEKALTDFKSCLEQTGWSHVGDNCQEDSIFATFKKDSQQAVVMVMGRDPNIVAHLLISKAPPEEMKKAELLGEDVAGEDIADIPRYPGATRISYESTPQGLTLEYLAHAGIPEVADFYAGRMSSDGWSLQAMETEEENTKISSVKIGRGFAAINIKPDDVFKGYTNIEIAFLLTK
ncbi:MAG: hypothetical protein FJ005_09055 [Chloroflexi bacterium]|nr:hypothetical protein [Chloroflexota bacterium]